MKPLTNKPEQPRSVNQNVDQEFLEPNKSREIKNTRHLIIPKGLNIKSKNPKQMFTAFIRQLVACGISVKDFSFHGDNFEEANACKKLLKVLCKMEEKLLESEYQGQLPMPNDRGKFILEERKLNKTFLLLEKRDGTFPKKPKGCGAGVVFIGHWKTPEEYLAKFKKQCNGIGLALGISDKNRVKKISYRSPLARLVALTRIQKRFFRI